MPRTCAPASEQRSGVQHLTAQKVFVLLGLVAFLVTSASATQIVHQQETIDVGSPTEVTINISYAELSSSKVSLLVPSSHAPEQVTATDPGGAMTCNYNDVESEITCEPNTRPEGMYNVTLEYVTQNPAADKGDYRALTHVRHVLVPMESYGLRVVLPEGYGTVDKQSVEAFTPEDAEAGSEGRRIFVKWHRDDISLGETLRFTVNYQELKVFEDVFPDRTAFFAAAILILVAALVFLYVRRGRNNTIAAVMPVLKEDEKEALRFLIEQDGECEQKRLVEELDYSKAKISRLVKDLEERNLIEKIKEGRKNRLVLKKEVGDVDFDDED